MKKLLLLILIAANLISCNNSTSRENSEQNDNEEFSFAFLTDIHIMEDRGAVEGFQMAIDCVNVLNPDFVLTGGDLVIDAMGASHSRADSLYSLYLKIADNLNMPVYNTMGNHENFGISRNSGIDPNDPDFGKKMFEKRVGKRYYSFDHKGWHFIVLDDIMYGEGTWGEYIGRVDSVQIAWIKQDLAGLDKSTPIVLSVHIPLVSVIPQITYGPLFNDIQSMVVTNARDVLVPFYKYNLKLVLQGHLHIVEDITVGEKTTFITGGAVCGKWWNTKKDADVQEGFVLVHVKGDDFTWKYIDYGWETRSE